MLTSHSANFLALLHSSAPSRDLRHTGPTCYGARLRLSLAKQPVSTTTASIKCDSCLEHFSSNLFFLIWSSRRFRFLFPVFVKTPPAQLPRLDLPPNDQIWEGGVDQKSEGEWKYLKGASRSAPSEMTITADEIDFNEDTAWAYARGHVHLEHYATGDILNANHAEYNLKTEEDSFTW